VPLDADPSTRQYFLDVPAAFAGALGDAGPGTVRVQLVAQRWTDDSHSALDPWFIRRSESIEIDVIEPYVTWRSQVPRLVTVPLTGRLISYAPPALSPLVPFGADLDDSRRAADSRRYPSFDTPPRLVLMIERFDDESGGYTGINTQAIEAAGGPESVAFSLAEGLGPPGRYRYRYRLEGTTAQGPFVVTSPWEHIDVRRGWEFAGLLGLGALTLISILSMRGATLQGTLKLTVSDGPRTLERRLQVPPAKRYGSEDLQSAARAGPQDMRLQWVAFTLRKRRWFYLRSSIGLTVTEPRMKASVGGLPVPVGRELALKPGTKHVLKWRDRLSAGGGEAAAQLDMTLY
jgi:hypothetical protein